MKLRVFYFGIILLLSISCSNNKGNQELKDAFFSEIEKKADAGGPIETLINADFEWHRMYHIPDWYTESSISEILGIEWHGPSVEDQYARLLFLDTTDNSTEFFDYGTNGGRINLICCYDVDTVINDCARTFLRKENCVFISEKITSAYYDYKAVSINCKNG
ncbi:MAG: hypothetical protein GQ574_12365 [Crocinitomix sp.]|nr:hypothetical protein [Crocinitomix sp.]